MLRLTLRFGLLAALLAAAMSVAGQTPACGLFAGWQQRGASRLFEGDNLFEYMDGNSEGYLVYGFVRMRGVTCTKAGDTLVFDISEFADAESAWGMFLANRDMQQPIEPIGTGAQTVPRKAIFAKDKYYVEFAAESDRDHTAELRDMAKIVEAGIGGSTSRPEPLAWFPPEGLAGGTARLAPESVLGIRLLKRGYVGQYGDAKAFVVTEASAEAARATLGQLKARFEGAAPAAVADEAFRVKDEYLGNICMFRKGRRVAGYANVPDGQDALALAGALAARIPE
jgi:hypothetical protein